MSLQIIILAAGQGKRMFSQKPKGLHELAGKPMLVHVLNTAKQLNPDAIYVVYGHGGEQLQKALSSYDVTWILQQEQLGTGHAVLQVLPHLPLQAQILVLSADVPLISTQTLKNMLACHQQEAAILTLLLAKLAEPTGLGRIVRDPYGTLCAIVEERDATIEQKQIQEIYTGICCAQTQAFVRWLPQLSCNNAQGEYYLTEIIAMAIKERLKVNALVTDDPLEIQGINDRWQLEQLERVLQQRYAKQLMLAGVSIADSARIDVRGELHCGQDVVIDVNTVFIGQVVLGNGSVIGPGCLLQNVTVGANTKILAYSILEDCQIGDNCQIGPFARLRPGTQLAAFCKIGNFVETKNTVFGQHSKANHLSYLGDATIGQEVNIGAGTITCNYDGANKHQTIIEDGVSIGSDTQLVAPVTIGSYATIGAGSTIRKNVPAHELTLTISEQKTIKGWKRPRKQKKGSFQENDKNS